MKEGVNPVGYCNSLALGIHPIFPSIGQRMAPVLSTCWYIAKLIWLLLCGEGRKFACCFFKEFVFLIRAGMHTVSRIHKAVWCCI